MTLTVTQKNIEDRSPSFLRTQGLWTAVLGGHRGSMGDINLGLVYQTTVWKGLMPVINSHRTILYVKLPHTMRIICG